MMGWRQLNKHRLGGGPALAQTAVGNNPTDT